MPRLPRLVVPHVPHHVTQRGNRRAQVFFTDTDRRAYLLWLRRYAEKWRVQLLAYCLMPNHVHLVAVPSTQDGLQRMLKPLHTQYAQRINRLRGWTGHVWQGRFFSSALDEPHMWAAVRYVERNPVRSGLVERAEAYPWSSARAHAALQTNPLLTSSSDWRARFASVSNWPAWLAEDDDDERLGTLRRHVNKGLPCGSPAFVAQLEVETERILHYRPQGGQMKATSHAQLEGERPLRRRSRRGASPSAHAL